MSEDRYCKACFQPIRTKPIRSLIEKEPLICEECLSKIDVRLNWRRHFGISVLFLSSYECILKDWLFQYKESLDIELAPCFLYLFKPVLKLLFKNSLFIPLPSSKAKVKKRGFNHLEEMLKSSHFPYITALEKGETEQKETTRTERYQDEGTRIIVHPEELKRKRIVLFDDVFTTGNTLKSAVEALKDIGVSHLKAVILLDNYNIETHRLK